MCITHTIAHLFTFLVDTTKASPVTDGSLVLVIVVSVLAAGTLIVITVVLIVFHNCKLLFSTNYCCIKWNF